VRRVVAVSLLAVALLLVPVVPSYAGGHGGHRGHGFGHHHGFHGHGVIVVGPSFWWGYPILVVLPAALLRLRYQYNAGGGCWRYTGGSCTITGGGYYCPSTRAYYPSVPTCSEAWIKVPPR